MEKPEEKKSNDAANRPPRPPVGAKKPEGVPKGPVPPRGQTGVPRLPLPGQNAGSPLKQTPAPMARPAMPSAGNAVPGLPAPMGGPMPFRPTVISPTAPAAGMPAKPPMPPVAPPAPSVPTSPFEKGLAEADKAKTDLEQKVSDLEKKLMEEREKVLLASLRSKEEEVVSAKVETSIKDIQDKLRREKKEHEMDEARRKAEERVLDVERRLAEEREAWVATLKTQLTQRDQISQDMETHFSTRLKDLEYRWAQEKSALEDAVRTKDAELVRVRQEFALKTEQEKAFWEDRLRAIAGDRDKMEREFERSKDKFQHEKDQLIAERQVLRDQVSRVEASMKVVEEQSRYEKIMSHREMEQAVNMVKNEARVESERFQSKILESNAVINVLKEEIKGHQNQIEKLRGELIEAHLDKRRQDNMAHEFEETKTRLEKLLFDARQAILDREKDANLKQGEYELKIEALTADLNKARLGVETEVARVQHEADARLKTIQARLDWYDSNADREYDLARDKVRVEIEKLQMQLVDANKKIRELSSAHDDVRVLTNEKEKLEKELERVRNEWKQTQWDTDGRVKEIQDELLREQAKSQHMDEARLALEQEIKQRESEHQYEQSIVAQRNAEIDRLQESLGIAEKNYESTKEKIEFLQKQIEEQKEIMRGRGLDSIDDLRMKLREREKELNDANQTIRQMKDVTQEAEKAEDLFKEKERVLKTVIDDKQDTIQEFKARIQALERSLNEKDDDIETIKAAQKKLADRAIAEKKMEADAKISEMEQSLAMERHKMMKIQQEQLEKIREEAAQKIREHEQSASSQMPVDQSAIEAQLRQQFELDKLDEIRNLESTWEEKIKKVKDEAKKEVDKVRWEAESMKTDLRKAREARAQIEREAQELLQQAEEHYRAELEKKVAELTQKANAEKGFFSSIGKLLDTPIVDTKKKKDPL